MLRLTMLPAGYGDAIWIEYGDRQRPHVVIVDCGFRDNYRELAKRIEGLQPDQLELMVLTHVDEDHIKGAIPLLADARLAPRDSFDVRFNGWDHLVEGAVGDDLGAMQGEFFSALIRSRGFRWNEHEAWGGAAIVVPAQGPLPRGELAGGLQWTLLSPTRDKLAKMRDFWENEVAAKAPGVSPGDHEKFLELFADVKSLQPDELGEAVDIAKLCALEFVEDDRAPNGSSIALLIEYEGKSVLLGADAHPSVIKASLDRLAVERGVGVIKVDAVKVSHHGSSKNTSAGMLGMLDCRTFLFSSNGEKHGHPAPQCVARIINHRKDGVRLIFNYDSPVSGIWRNALRGKHAFETEYPDPGETVLEL